MGDSQSDIGSDTTELNYDGASVFLLLLRCTNCDVLKQWYLLCQELLANRPIHSFGYDDMLDSSSRTAHSVYIVLFRESKHEIVALLLPQVWEGLGTICSQATRDSTGISL